MTHPDHLPGLTIRSRPQFYHCEPGWHWSPTPLPDYDLWHVLNGRGTLTLAGQDYPLVPGATFVLAPGAAPRGRQDEHHRLHVFAVHFIPEDDGPLPIPPPGLVLRDRAWFAALAQRCAACGRRGDPLGQSQSRLLLGQMLLHLWEEALCPPPSPGDARIAEMTQRIAREPGRAWSVTDLAREACLSRSQFTRRFQAVNGLSPTQFVIQTRLERAAQLIRETDMTLTQIAAALGYPDLYFFSRQFKKRFGHPPSLLRKRG